MLVLNLGIGGSRFRFAGEPAFFDYSLGPHPVDYADALAGLAGKRVCILVPGYNVDQAIEACAQMALSLGSTYDQYVAVDWPGSITLGFWFAYHRAQEAGRRLADVFRFTRCELGIQTHSTGARIALEAACNGLRFDHTILSAAAVPADALAAGYGAAAGNLGRVGIFYSRRDPVLRWAYSLAMFHRALGSIGPRGDMPANATAYDLTALIDEHGGYKDQRYYYAEWATIASNR